MTSQSNSTQGNLPLFDRPLRWIGEASRPRGLALPPAHMPMRLGGRLLKQWRFVGIWTKELFVCAGVVKVGPVPQEFWAVWDRPNKRFLEVTRFSLFGKRVTLPPRRMLVKDGEVAFDIALDENQGFEVATPDRHAAYTWTRKQLIPARGTVRFGGKQHDIDGLAFIDDNAGYHSRRMSWKWTGGVGTDREGRVVGWNIIVGLNDSPLASENTVWIDGVAKEVGQARFADDLSSVSFAQGGTLNFHEETTRARRDNLILIRSDYAQPMGTFTGTLPGGIELQESFGVMERHEALW